MNRKNRVCSAALSAVLTLTLVTAPAQALDTAGAERTEGGYAVMQAVSGLSIGEIDSSGIIYNGKAQTPTPKSQWAVRSWLLVLTSGWNTATMFTPARELRTFSEWESMQGMLAAVSSPFTPLS